MNDEMTLKAEEPPLSHYRIVNEYPHPPAKVWRALTDPALVPLGTSTGKGAPRRVLDRCRDAIQIRRQADARMERSG